MLPVLPALRELLPRGGLARGSVVSVAEFGLLALAPGARRPSPDALDSATRTSSDIRGFVEEDAIHETDNECVLQFVIILTFLQLFGVQCTANR